MYDPRISKLAQVLVHYSLEIQPGQKFIIQTNPLAEDLALAVFEEALRKGAHVYVLSSFPRGQEIFLKHATEEQLSFPSPFSQLVVDTFDASLLIGAEQNTRELSGIDPSRQAIRQKAGQPQFHKMMQRTAEGTFRWCYTEYPTYASAQEADMSLGDYQDFVFAAGKLNEPDPVALWRAEGERQQRLVDWLAGRDQVVLKGADIDLRMSIKGRTFIRADGKYNFPDGEIFTGPVEDSVNGWVRFQYPAIYSGREVNDVQLWFENGRVVKEQASKGEELLTSLLNTDPGARYLGEWGIGTNYEIPRFTKNMLFDEKLGGTIHLAVGASYPESGGKNESGVHWDMLCDMHEAEVTVDGDLFYKDGNPAI